MFCFLFPHPNLVLREVRKTQSLVSDFLNPCLIFIFPLFLEPEWGRFEVFFILSIVHPSSDMLILVQPASWYDLTQERGLFYAKEEIVIRAFQI
jgi:hypothetical protein